MEKKQYKLLWLITALYITFQLISDITAWKIISLFWLSISVTVLYFPVTYILADVITEVYWYNQSRKIIWLVFLCSVIAWLIYTLVVYLPPAIWFNWNEAYTRVLWSIPRILLWWWIAVWVWWILNDYTLAKMKVFTQWKHLWARTIWSTIIWEWANTSLFYVIALYWILPNNLLVSSILAGWWIKVLVEVIFTPITYVVISKVKKIESEDYYDSNTNFNPFILK